MIGPWDKSLLYLLSSFQFCSAYHDVFTQFQWNKGAVCVPLDHGHREQTPAPQRAVLITDSVKIAGERAMNRAWWGHVVDDGFIPGASPAAFFLNGTIWYSSLLFIFFFFFFKGLNKEKSWEFSRYLAFILSIWSELNTIFKLWNCNAETQILPWQKS